MRKFPWAVEAGDQIGHSEDDQECGDHFIEKGLECHDGDAHRPTPGKNPYFQGDRKGPQDKSKTPERDSSGNQRGHERDRSEQTPQSQKRQKSLEDSGYTPESYAEENVDNIAKQMETAYEEKTGNKLDWSDNHIDDLIEQSMRHAARGFSLSADELGFHDSTAPFGHKGKKGRALWRPRKGERLTEDGNQYVPPGHEGESGGALYQAIFERAQMQHQPRPKNENVESSLSSALHWGKESVASKPKFGKATEHSGAKKGKGAWTTKKDAKSTSNKARRAGGKQAVKEQSVGEEKDSGAFPGAAPLFARVNQLRW